MTPHQFSVSLPNLDVMNDSIGMDVDWPSIEIMQRETAQGVLLHDPVLVHENRPGPLTTKGEG